MGKKFQPKDKHLQKLLNNFEESLETNESIFIPEEELEKLIEFYESLPDYGKALLALNKAVELFPYSPVFHLKRAQVFIGIKDFDNAWDSLHQAKIFEPFSQEVLLVEADLHTAEGYYEDALSTLNQLIDISTEDQLPDIYLEFADVYEAQGNEFELERVLATILIDFPENEEAIHRYWSVIADQEKMEEGIDTFRKNTDIRPYNFLAWYYLAKSYEGVGLYEKALEAFEYTIAINDYYFAYWDYALCLQEVEQYDQAISTYFEMLELFDQDLTLYFEIGHCYSNSEEYIKARKSFESVLDLTNELKIKAQAHYCIGKTFEWEDQYQLALRHYKKASELNQKKTKYLNAIARCCYNLEHYEKAAEIYMQSLAINDEQGKIWRNLAKAYFQLDMEDLLLNILDKSSSILPLDSKLQYHYSGYLLHFGYLQAGLHQLEKALILDSTRKNSIFAIFPELENRMEVLELLEQFED